MTNTELLNEWIEKSGKKKKFLAKKCNLSYAGFQNCVTNKAEFKISHVQILCEELGVKKLEDRQAIFFASNVA